MEWEPSVRLRYVRTYITGTLVLQQEWRRARQDGRGHIDGWDYEWREVEIVDAVDANA